MAAAIATLTAGAHLGGFRRCLVQPRPTLGEASAQRPRCLAFYSSAIGKKGLVLARKIATRRLRQGRLEAACEGALKDANPIAGVFHVFFKVSQMVRDDLGRLVGLAVQDGVQQLLMLR